jgi:hypothetical protein
MNINNSGKIYRFNLDFDFGFSYAQLIDHSDKYDFSGRLIYVYTPQKIISHQNNELKEIVASKILFGPVPLYRYPNVKGRGAWKYIGKTTQFIRTPPVFKKVLASEYDTWDWSKLKTWYSLTSFEKRSDFVNYEDVRYLEMPVLHTTRDIEIRTTMHKILLDKKKVEKYYDLRDTDLRLLYIELINTCFKKNETLKYLKSIK